MIGTTWHTAGLLWRLRPSDAEIHLINTTRELLTRLEDETGVNPGWINNGGLFIASSNVSWMTFKWPEILAYFSFLSSCDFLHFASLIWMKRCLTIFQIYSGKTFNFLNNSSKTLNKSTCLYRKMNEYIILNAYQIILWIIVMRSFISCIHKVKDGLISKWTLGASAC